MSATPETTPDNHWSLDKRIPIALIATLAIQTGGVLVWAGQVSQRIDMLERQSAEQKSFGERITRVEVTVETVKETTKDMKDAVTRIEQKIDTIGEQQRKTP
jgi:hypothetical protein